MTPFAYLATGRDLHLYRASKVGRKLTLAIVHFSGYGYGAATAAERKSLARRVPRDPQARAEAELSSQPSPAALLSTMKAVADRIEKAETDDSGLLDAVNEARGFDLSLKVLGRFTHDPSLLQRVSAGGCYRPSRGMIPCVGHWVRRSAKSRPGSGARCSGGGSRRRMTVRWNGA